jgi:hypothetical protein
MSDLSRQEWPTALADFHHMWRFCDTTDHAERGPVELTVGS